MPKNTYHPNGNAVRPAVLLPLPAPRWTFDKAGEALDMLTRMKRNGNDAKFIVEQMQANPGPDVWLTSRRPTHGPEMTASRQKRIGHVRAEHL